MHATRLATSASAAATRLMQSRAFQGALEVALHASADESTKSSDLQEQLAKQQALLDASIEMVPMIQASFLIWPAR